MNVEIINKTLSLVAIFGLIGVVISSFTTKGRAFFAKHGLHMGLLVAIWATLGSFYYSDVVHYAPCVLCWYQRIFLFPQVILLGIAVWRKDVGIRIYSLALAGIGALIAVYHILVEHNITPSPCLATGVSCSVRYVYEFGFVSIAVMSLITFLLIIASVYFAKKSE